MLHWDFWEGIGEVYAAGHKLTTVSYKLLAPPDEHRVNFLGGQSAIVPNKQRITGELYDRSGRLFERRHDTELELRLDDGRRYSFAWTGGGPSGAIEILLLSPKQADSEV